MYNYFMICYYIHVGVQSLFWHKTTKQIIILIIIIIIIIISIIIDIVIIIYHIKRICTLRLKLKSKAIN
jgi:hypothetical protein